ncbi:MAG: hypothetical protein GY811_26130 [Myxococcales bacterium]|nr:hypothetical protein [Myxococcales bacterium]
MISARAMVFGTKEDLDRQMSFRAALGAHEEGIDPRHLQVNECDALH